jgi:serine/threonine protein kinase
MLAGSRPFPGDSTAQTLGAVLSREPEWQLLPRSTPETVKSLLRRCLAKDPKQRLHHIADVRVEIDHILASPTSVERRALPSRRSIALAATAVLAMIVVLFVVRIGINTVSNRKADQPLEIRERQITSNPIEDPIAFAAISPDGKFVAYNDSTAIRIRLIDTGETRALVVPPDFCFI